MRITALRTWFAAALTLLLVGLTQAPATAATYTWFNGRSYSNTTHYEPSSAQSFSRTGVSAKIAGANGPLFSTTVWFNGYSVSGQDAATITGPRSFARTSARWYFVPDRYANDYVDFRVWLLDARLSGTSSAEKSASLQDSTSTGTAETMEEADEVTVDELQENTIPGLTVELQGSQSGFDYWIGESDAGDVYLFASADEYVAYTHKTSGDFARSGIALSVESPTSNVQALLLPPDTEGNQLARSGMARLGDSLYVRPDNGRIQEFRLDRGTAPALEIRTLVAPLRPAK